MTATSGPLRGAISTRYPGERADTGHPVEHGRRWRHVSVWLAIITLVLIGMRFEVQYTLTLGMIAGVALSPLWIRSLARYSGALLVGAGIILCVASGLWLSALSAETHVVSTQYLLSNAIILVGMGVFMGVVLWARELLPIWAIGLAYGTGVLIDTVTGGLDPESPWKFGFAMPVVLLALSALSGRAGRALTVVVILALAAFSAFNDARSLFAELTITALLVAWQMIPHGRTLRRSAMRTLIAFAVIGLAAYNAAVSLLLEGYLGNEAQQRTIEQVDAAGSVLLGGRPEMAATWALFQAQPAGYGLGVQPTLSDILTAKTGMAAINYAPNNGYVENYMFGSTFEVHSTIGDFWASYGIPGILFVLLVAVLALRWIGVSIAARNADPLTLFLALLLLWNVLFSPFYSSATAMGITLGLMLLRRGDATSDPLPESIRDETLRER